MKLLFASALVLSTLGCSRNSMTTESSASEGRLSPTYGGPAEVPYCARVVTYPTKVTLRGQANYLRRVAWGDQTSGGLGSASLSGAHPAELRPIRQAEVRVTDPGGGVVQCGVTDDTGAFALDLPRGDVDYVISVNSRAEGALLNASVLDKPEMNRAYGIAATRNARVTPAPLTLTATADGDVLGGAFNILDMIYEANRYLRAQVSSCSASFDGCRDVTPAAPIPKVTAYWEKGFNPNSYFGATSGLSFYLPGYHRLFILGGEEGDVDFSDTDHFDNSIIVHEYGHFLEDVVGKSDSPGGSHNGNAVIDPRLAWSEGWGNFIQGAVLGIPSYVDTTGNDDGDTALAFDVSLETGDDLSPETSYDVPENPGEGNYREFSVTRLLWDVIDNTPTEFVNSAYDNVVLRFPEIWAAFSSKTRGYAFGAYAFRNVGLLHLIQRDYQAKGDAVDWAQVRQIERHTGDESTYGQYVQTTGCAATLTAAGDGAPNYNYQITPANLSDDLGTLETSHLLLNNRFYHLKVTSSGYYPLTLTYVDASRSGAKADLDLYVYNHSARFALDQDIVAMNTNANAGGVAAVESKSVRPYLAAGDYLINVNVNTSAAVGTTAYYNLSLGSARLCPSSLVPQ